MTTPPSAPHFVFVYGTLKRGYGNNRLLARAKFVGEATTVAPHGLYHLGGFPGMVAADRATAGDIPVPVKGELFQVTPEELRHCDALEGHPSFYRRTPIQVVVDGEATPQTWRLISSREA